LEGPCSKKIRQTQKVKKNTQREANRKKINPQKRYYRVLEHHPEREGGTQQNKLHKQKEGMLGRPRPRTNLRRDTGGSFLGELLLPHQKMGHRRVSENGGAHTTVKKGQALSEASKTAERQKMKAAIFRSARRWTTAIMYSRKKKKKKKKKKTTFDLVQKKVLLITERSGRLDWGTSTVTETEKVKSGDDEPDVGGTIQKTMVERPMVGRDPTRKGDR